LEDLEAVMGINSALVTIRESKQKSAKEILSYYELKTHKQ
jgi:hypothetical protein